MTFSLDLSKALSNIKEDVDKVMRGTLTQLSVNIIKATPVGNPDLWVYNHPERGYIDYVGYLGVPDGYIGGSLRGAWNASFQHPDFSLSGRIEKAAGGNTASEISSVISTFEVGETFYLTNPLPYAYRVEYGWSSQRPEGMLRVNLMQAQRIMDSIK